MNRDQARQKVKSWRENPVKFVYDNFKVDPDAWQRDALEYVGNDFKEYRRLCMKACTGPGKSAVLAWIGWHRLSCFGERGEHPKGAALSITRENLSDNLWSEMAKWQQRSLFLSEFFVWNKQSIYAKGFAGSWFLSARSFAKDADEEAIGRALSGLHSRFPFVLLDETGDMPTTVGRVAQQIFTGSPKDALIAQAGNPTSTSGLLYETAGKTRSDWHVITITADPDDPQRTPRVDIEHAQKMIDDYGRDDPWVMATILGLFPPVGFNALLGIDDVEAAMERHYNEDQFSFAPIILGVDVAREGDDMSVIFPRQGIVAHKPWPFRGVKSYDLAGHIGRKFDGMQADGTIIDGTGGYGSGVIDAYEQLGRTALDCQFAAKAEEPKRFYNKRAEIWWKMAEWVKAGGALPRIPDLVGELTTPTYSYKGDRILIEPKEEVKKRLGRSPDFADGLAVTFAFDIQKRHMLDMLIEKAAGTKNQEYDPFAEL